MDILTYRLHQLAGKVHQLIAGIKQLPAGGSAGQLLAKASSQDFAVGWIDPPSGGGGAWGLIGGILSAQTDLQAALNSKESAITAGGTTQYWRGDKTWQTLNKAAVGLSSVDNTADVDKPVSTAQQTALNGKQAVGAYLTANQTITLSGDVTGTGSTAIAVSIGANKVTRGMLAVTSGATILGATTAGNVTDLTAGQAKAFLAITASDVSGLAAVATSGSAADLSAGTLPVGRMPALTGDVTTAAGAVATTIANSAVTLAKMANMATASLIYRKTAGSGAPEVQTLVTLKADLGLTGTNSGDQTITLTGDVTGSGTGSFAVSIGANKVTRGMLAAASGATLLGAAAAGNVSDLTAAQAKTVLAITASDVSALGYFATGTDAANLTGTVAAGRLPAFTGDVTTAIGTVAMTIAAGAVSLSKMANVATATVFYRKTAGTGSPEVQTLATLKTDLGLTGTNSGDQTITLTGDATGSGTGSFAVTVGKVNGVSLAGLATGILKNTTTTGAPSIAVAADFPTLNQNTTGTAANVTGVVAVANGGTNASSVSGALTNLGLGTSNSPQFASIGVGAAAVANTGVYTSASVNGVYKNLLENTNAGSGAFASQQWKNDAGNLGVIFMNGSNNTAYAGANSLLLNNASANALAFGTNDTVRWIVSAAGHFTAWADNAYDIGAAGASRPRNLYVAGQGTFGGSITASNPQFTGVSYYQQSSPTALSATATLTVAQLLTLIVTVTSATAVTLTVPTGTLTDAGILSGALAVDEAFEWYIINLGSSSGAVTLAAGTGHTIVGSATVAIGTSARFLTRKTATNTFVTYRIA